MRSSSGNKVVKMPGNLERLIQFVRVVQSLPLIRPFWSAVYHARFTRNRSRNLFFGVFDDFESAARAAPPEGRKGFDNAESAGISYFVQESANEYPGFLWLQNSLREGHRKIFDLGGHVGVTYYNFKKRGFIPAETTWTVCDVPAVVKRGA